MCDQCMFASLSLSVYLARVFNCHYMLSITPRVILDLIIASENKISKANLNECSIPKL